MTSRARSNAFSRVVKLRCTAVAAGLLLLSSATLWACQVPVFRYTLERWRSDDYLLLVLHRQPLTADQQSHVELLSKSADGPRSASWNAVVHQLSPQQISDASVLAHWETHSAGGTKPVLLVLYPRDAREVPDRIAWAGPLNQRTLEQVRQSPVRAELGQRLASGQSAVWVFVPGGDPQQNKSSLERLHSELRRNEQLLKLASMAEMELDPALVAKNKIELRVEFSVITLDRADPAEQFVLQSLLRSEPDLQQLDQPMAFAVFGRGRVLYALVGPGIKADTIQSACSFLVGPCSCQVKAQNPGFDLLMHHDWDTAVADSLLSDPLPSNSSGPVLLTIPPGRTTQP